MSPVVAAQTPWFLELCLQKAFGDHAGLQELAEACEFNGLSALSFAHYQVDLLHVASTLFISLSEARCLVEACRQLCAATNAVPGSPAQGAALNPVDHLRGQEDAVRNQLAHYESGSAERIMLQRHSSQQTSRRSLDTTHVSHCQNYRASIDSTTKGHVHTVNRYDHLLQMNGSQSQSLSRPLDSPVPFAISPPSPLPLQGFDEDGLQTPSPSTPPLLCFDDDEHVRRWKAASACPHTESCDSASTQQECYRGHLCGVAVESDDPNCLAESLSHPNSWVPPMRVASSELVRRKKWRRSNNCLFLNWTCFKAPNRMPFEDVHDQQTPAYAVWRFNPVSYMDEDISPPSAPTSRFKCFDLFVCRFSTPSQ